MKQSFNTKFYEAIRPYLTHLSSSRTQMKFFAYKINKEGVSPEVLKKSIEAILTYIRQGGLEGKLTKELSEYRFEVIGEFTTKLHMEKYAEDNGWTIIRPIHGEESISYIEMTMLVSSVFEAEDEKTQKEWLSAYKKEQKRIQKIR